MKVCDSFSFENKSDLFEVEPAFTMKGFNVLIFLIYTLDVSTNLDPFLYIFLFLCGYSTRC